MQANVIARVSATLCEKESCVDQHGPIKSQIVHLRSKKTISFSRLCFCWVIPTQFLYLAHDVDGEVDVLLAQKGAQVGYELRQFLRSISERHKQTQRMLASRPPSPDGEVTAQKVHHQHKTGHEGDSEDNQDDADPGPPRPPHRQLATSPVGHPHHAASRDALACIKVGLVILDCPPRGTGGSCRTASYFFCFFMLLLFTWSSQTCQMEPGKRAIQESRQLQRCQLPVSSRSQHVEQTQSTRRVSRLDGPSIWSPIVFRNVGAMHAGTMGMSSGSCEGTVRGPSAEASSYGYAADSSPKHYKNVGRNGIR